MDNVANMQNTQDTNYGQRYAGSQSNESAGTGLIPAFKRSEERSVG